MNITRVFGIDYGHRLIEHGGKCKNYHGHRMTLEVSVASQGLNDQGMVIDFGLVKEKIGKWLDENWDHGMILQAGDPMIELLDRQGMRCYVLFVPPTVENLVVHFWSVIAPLCAALNVRLAHVRMYETPNCFADYSGPEGDRS